tara:strand:- start:1102 stop:2070 length:969 start_codon:yes stop_codon:yes gene_type:complete
MYVSLILITCLNFFILRYIRKIIGYINLFDYPDNNRKIHREKIAPIGGVIILINLICFYLINFFLDKNIHELLMLIFAVSIFILGFIDDKFRINSNLKFILFIFFAFLLFYFDNNLIINELSFSFLEKNINIGKYSLFFSIFSLVIFLNAFNMFDGINLQSSLYAIFILLIFVFHNFYFNISIIIILSLIFFLILNYKNICFLGDNGSLLIAFLISYIFFQSANDGIFFADEILLIMLVPGIDLIRLFFLRLRQKKSPFSPDNNHFHHHLINKFGLIKTNIYILFLIIGPYIVAKFTNNFVLLIIFTILIYFFMLRALKVKI